MQTAVGRDKGARAERERTLWLSQAQVWLAAILAVALIARVAWLANTDTEIPTLSDPQYYQATAANIADGRGYSVAVDARGFVAGPGSEPTAFWAPGFPFALSPLYALFGPDVRVAKLFNAVAGALTVLPIFYIGRRLRNDACGLLSAGLFALAPAPVFWTPAIFSEALFVLGVATTMATAMWAARAGTIAAYFVTGIALIATAFVRSQAIALLAPVAVLLLPDLSMKSIVRTMAPIVAAIALFVVPWAVRNEVVMGEPYLINSNLGYNLRLAHAPYSTGTSVPPQDLWDEEPGISFKERERLFDELGRERAIEYALDHPGRELELAIRRAGYLLESDAAAAIHWSESLGRTPIGWGRDAYVLLGDIYWYALLAVATASLGLLPRTREWWALWSMAGVWLLLHTVFAGEPRYHLPMLPALVALAAGSLLAGFERVAGRGHAGDST